MDSGCQSYEPGHLTSREEAREMIRARTTGIDCRVAEVRPDGTVIVDVAGSSIVLWHHDPEVLKHLMDDPNYEATFSPEQSSLFIRPSKTHAGSHGFHMASDDADTSCLLLSPTANQEGTIRR